MSENIKQGSSLYGAMERHGTIFSPLYVSMIRAGEMSGTVTESLERLIYIIEHEAKIKADIKSALQYPIMVTVALVVAFFVLLTFVIPKFVDMFSKAGIVLPLPTRIAIMLYNFLANYWYLLIVCTIGLFVGLRIYLKTEKGQYDERHAYPPPAHYRTAIREGYHVTLCQHSWNAAVCRCSGYDRHEGFVRRYRQCSHRP